jgi:hypothetical protein
VQNNLRLQVSDEITDVPASPYLSAVFGAGEATSFWKRGSFRSGSKNRRLGIIAKNQRATVASR